MSSGGRRTPTQSDHKEDEEANLTINIPGGGAHRGFNRSQSDHPQPQRKRREQSEATVVGSADSQAYQRSRSSSRPSFHSRDSVALHQAEYHPDLRSPYTNPSHYSARPQTYHQRSQSHMSSVPTTPTSAQRTGRHGQEGSNDDVGHARGPTSAIDRAIEANATDRTWQTAEEGRLDEDVRKERHWRRWGCYMSERQWGTVREDYSGNGDAWTHFPHEVARSRTFRWGEDGIAGLCDNHGRMCFSLALWNGKDRMLKERLFGLANNEGNHGEDVKELYWYLDNTPTHSYMKMLYKYPQSSFPYEQMVRESRNRSRDVAEFEITDTELFDEEKYWDVYIEYAKDKDEENAISVRISAYNRGPEDADLHIIPQLLFKNYWSWPKEEPAKPLLEEKANLTIQADHHELGRSYLYCSTSPAPSAPPRKRGAPPELISEEEITPELLFTENETNFERLYNGKNKSFAKDAFHDHIVPAHRLEKDQPQPIRKTRTVKRSITRTVKVPKKGPNGTSAPNGVPAKQNGINGQLSDLSVDDGEDEKEITEEVEEEEEYFEASQDTKPTRDYVNPEKKGTKAGAHYFFQGVPANGGCAVVRIKLTPKSAQQDPTINDDEAFDALIDARQREADEFYTRIASGPISDDMKNIMRQALAGMLWNKQHYTFIQPQWIAGDPGQPPPPPERKHIRNKDWRHLHMEDVLSMPDKWEYPFPAVWDSAFHCIPLAMVDPTYAKKQLDLFTREWYMKPDGALPAYEWNFSDVNPPVHAWATFRVFKIERKMYGREDLDFLERVFQKLLINFTWWVNRKDSEGSNVFEGGFLGLDNIGPFNRSEPLPTGGKLRQADGTAWMAFYALNMLNMALELAKHNPTYEDIASKFFEHFIFISDAMTYRDSEAGGEGVSLWSEDDGFYYDAISWGDGSSQVIPVRSLVGLIPLYATLTLEPSVLRRFPSFAKRMQWFLDNRPEMSGRNIANMKAAGKGERRLLSMVSRERLELVLRRMLDETEFLSQYGIRSLSKYHQDHPFSVHVGGEDFSVAYWSGDSHSPMFGGNSNWRGPIWLAVNFLMVESLQRFYQYYGEDFKIECPTGSGDFMHLGHLAEELQHRLIRIFSQDDAGRRPCNGGVPMLDFDPNFRNLVQFHEFFDGNSAKGLGASHQCGWTGLVAFSIMSAGMTYRATTPRTPRSTAQHYFDEQFTDDGKSDAGSAFSMPYSTSFSRPPSPDEL
ncbi:glycoside hydrolase family 63 protein [Ceraceosorus bombacis]|uniref:Glycoside hydrolase family 63 protein n=1 Tax=Ceraceosorus bombacis TaxID=401625 RepID=A0A0P1BQE4_9BASI|nr:glycoside hydrolase family 63 protein [Ceraceosorus bombacis]